MRTPRAAPKRAACSSICVASSRVGARTSARMPCLPARRSTSGKDEGRGLAGAGRGTADDVLARQRGGNGPGLDGGGDAIAGRGQGGLRLGREPERGKGCFRHGTTHSRARARARVVGSGRWSGNQDGRRNAVDAAAIRAPTANVDGAGHVTGPSPECEFLDRPGTQTTVLPGLEAPCCRPVTAPLISNVSDTARWVAVYRAWETARPRSALPRSLRRAAGRRAGKADRRPAPDVANGPQRLATHRPHQGDRRSRPRLGREGCRCVLNLAAGLDTRPYRLPLPKDTVWIEADLPAILEEKATGAGRRDAGLRAGAGERRPRRSHRPRCLLRPGGEGAAPGRWWSPRAWSSTSTTRWSPRWPGTSPPGRPSSPGCWTSSPPGCSRT